MRTHRESDEQDSTAALYLNYALCALIVILLFVTDWLFDRKILDAVILGIIIGKGLDWITKMNEYFFPGGRPPLIEARKTEQKP